MSLSLVSLRGGGGGEKIIFLYEIEIAKQFEPAIESMRIPEVKKLLTLLGYLTPLLFVH